MSWSSIQQFLKAQLSAFVGGIVDYGIMLICKEIFGISVANSIRISGAIGAVVNFSINKFWTFKDQKQDTPVGYQLLRFVLVVIGSILLKSTATPWMSDITGIDYKITRLIVEIIVSLGFNYTLQKYWVFKKG